jgi:hypothetical protein
MVTEAPASTEIVDIFIGRIAERRRRNRVIVQWAVRIYRSNEHILDTCTVNVSSGGFYCVCSQPLSAGEDLIALLEIPGGDADHQCRKLVLHCEVLVLRVEALSNSRSWGIAFRIKNYSVVKPPAAASSRAENAERKSSAIAEKVEGGYYQNAAFGETS